MYPSCSQYVFAASQCVPLDDGTSWLRSDLSVDCDSPEHAAIWLSSFAFAFVYPIGIPSYFAYKLLWEYGEELEKLARIEMRAQAHATLRRVKAKEEMLDDEKSHVKTPNKDSMAQTPAAENLAVRHRRSSFKAATKLQLLRKATKSIRTQASIKELSNVMYKGVSSGEVRALHLTFWPA